MRLIDRINAALGFRPKLRNKAGGMAWIKGLDERDGDGALNGRAVKTVRLNGVGQWEIDPPQDYVVRRLSRFSNGCLALPGEVVTVTGIPDEFLEPWRETGLDAEDESHRYLPPVPKIKEPEPCLTKS
jgi:hypothetical protein